MKSPPRNQREARHPGSSHQGGWGAGRQVGPGRQDAREGQGAVRGAIIFGIEPVREMLAAQPEAVEALYLKPNDQRRFAREIEQVRRAGGRVITVDDAELSRAAGSQARHQGIVATIRPYHYADLKEMLDGQPDVILLIDGVTDPRNLGAILRSAEGSGFRSVLLARDRTAGITPAAIKTSAGALFHLSVAQCGNVARILEQLKQKGYWVAALTPDGATSLYDLDVHGQLVLVVGAEGEGVRPLVKKNADYQVRIPLYGKVDSLNVSVAAALALFEIRRRREGLLSVLSNRF